MKRINANFQTNIFKTNKKPPNKQGQKDKHMRSLLCCRCDGLSYGETDIKRQVSEERRDLGERRKISFIENLRI